MKRKALRKDKIFIGVEKETFCWWPDEVWTVQLRKPGKVKRGKGGIKTPANFNRGEDKKDKSISKGRARSKRTRNKVKGGAKRKEARETAPQLRKIFSLEEGMSPGTTGGEKAKKAVVQNSSRTLVGGYPENKR